MMDRTCRVQIGDPSHRSMRSMVLILEFGQLLLLDFSVLVVVKGATSRRDGGSTLPATLSSQSGLSSLVLVA